MVSRPGNSRKYSETAYGKAVLFFRTQLEVTQEELALKVGLPKNRISAIESGETRRPRQETISTLVIGLKALGLDVDLGAFEKKVDEYKKEIELAKRMPSYFASMQATRCFTGRDKELQAIESAFWSADYKVADIRAVVASGLGGIGKTTLVKEYAARNQKRYAGVCWLDSEHADSLDEGLINLGASFNSSIRTIDDKKSAAGVVFTYLAENAEEVQKPWLLIYDNIEEQSVLDLRKPRGGVHMLLTSRAKGWGADIKTITVESWDTDVATDYLIKASGRSDLIKEQVNRLAYELGGLPLAVSHAAALLQRNAGDTANSFLEKLYKRIRQVPKNAEYDRHVYATFHEAIEVCEDEVPGARALLYLASVFSPDAIPFEIYQQAPGLYGGQLQKVIQEQDTFVSLLGVLSRNSLVQLDNYNQHFSMHRIVQKVIRSDLEGQQRKWIDIAVSLLLELCPGEGHENWPEFERLLLHIKAVLDYSTDIESKDIATLSQKVGTYLYERGIYQDAEPYYERALLIREKLLGDDHPDFALVLDKMGVLYDYQGRHDEAELIHCRALAIREAKLGKDHVEVGNSLNNLALAYYLNKRYELAEELFKRAKNIRVQCYGPEHPKVAQCQSNLALVYMSRKEYKKAEENFIEALAIRRKELGESDPQVAVVMHHLGRLYIELEKFKEAEKYLLRTLEIRKNKLGKKHPFVANTLKFLGILSEKKGLMEDALSFYRKAHNVVVNSLPEGHARRVEVEDKLVACLELCGVNEDSNLALQDSNLALQDSSA